MKIPITTIAALVIAFVAMQPGSARADGKDKKEAAARALHRETDARAFGKLYEKLTGKARAAYRTKAGQEK